MYIFSLYMYIVHSPNYTGPRTETMSHPPSLMKKLKLELINQHLSQIQKKINNLKSFFEKKLRMETM